MWFIYGTGYSREVAVKDNFAYLIGWDCGGHACQFYYPYLEIVDVSNPLTPTFTATGYVYSPGHFGNYSLKVSGHYLSLAGSQATVYDIADPTKSALILTLPSDSLNINPVDIAAASDYIYLAVNDFQGERLEIIDVSDLGTANHIGSYLTTYPLSSIYNVAGYLYVIEGGSGRTLHVLDISNPAVPVEVNTYHHPWYIDTTLIGRLIVEGNYAYVGGNVLDISDPANPTLVGFRPLLGDLAVEGQYIYMVDYYGGWYVLKQSPVLVSLAPGVSSSLTYTDHPNLSTHFNFPAASVPSPSTVMLHPSTAEDIAGYSFARHTFQLSAVEDETQIPFDTFTAPVTITLHYSHDDVGVISNEGELALWVWTEDGWQDATTTCDSPSPYVRDIVNNVLTLTICQTGRFALFGPTNRHYFPFIDRH
jgi:hypothetical protein